MLDTWGNIAVLLDAPAEVRQVDGVGGYAARLAHRDNAHLIGIISLRSHPIGHPGDSYSRGKQAMRNVIGGVQTKSVLAAVWAARRLAALARRHHVISELRFTGGSAAEDGAALNLLHCDLVIVGDPKPPSLPDRWTPERLLYAAGAPVLIVPEWLRSDAIGKHVLVAWNASREAGRAVADAMPFIANAEKVTVLVIDAEKKAGGHGEQPGVPVALYLARHGAKVDVVRASPPDEGVAEGILSYATNHGVDLIVIGAHIHARSTERLLGGVTRTMLTHVHTPLLISH